MKTILTLLVIITSLSLSASAKEFSLSVNTDKLMYALVKIENPRKNINAVGDKHLKHKAHGLLQVRKTTIDDAKRIAGENEIRRKWGKRSLSESDMKNFAKAKWVSQVCLSHYGKYYTKKTGKIPTLEVYARIHNGGPFGWNKSSTRKYGKRAVKYAKAYSKSKRIS